MRGASTRTSVARAAAGWTVLEEITAERVSERPEREVTVRGAAACPTIRRMRKPGRRQVRIEEGSREQELARFAAAHRFASRAECNDMGVVVDVGSAEEEDRAAADIRSALARRHEPFRQARAERHC